MKNASSTYMAPCKSKLWIYFSLKNHRQLNTRAIQSCCDTTSKTTVSQSAVLGGYVGKNVCDVAEQYF